MIRTEMCKGLPAQITSEPSDPFQRRPDRSPLHIYWTTTTKLCNGWNPDHMRNSLLGWNNFETIMDRQRIERKVTDAWVVGATRPV